MAVTQENRDIEIFTPLGKDVLLVMDVGVVEELGRLFTINVELASTENITFEDLLGKNVSIRLNLPGGQRFFNGHVSSISQDVDEGHLARYSATIHPWLWFLTRTSDCRIFQHLTVPDIIKQVCSELGFTDIEDKLTASYRTWEYCVQYRETDFNFLSRLMEQEGIYYYFSHEKGKHTLNLADGYGSHAPIPGYAKIPYYPPNSTVVRDNDQSISSWFLSKRIQPGAYVLNEYDCIRPKADLKVNSNIPRKHSEAEHEIYDYPGEYVQSKDGDIYARTRIEELHTKYEQGQGHGEARGLTCGGLFSLTLFPRKEQNREYLVVSVNHNIHIDDYSSAGGGGNSDYTNSFTVIESKTPYRSGRVTPKPVVQGLQTAMVVGPSGEEIYTDEHGRVKLQFHWDRYGESNENSSCWIRVSQVHAGRGFGAVDIPRIGEEVVVSFEEGDPDRPLVIGRVYNGDNKAPNGLPAAKMVSGLKSNTTPGGGGNNSIMLDDTKSKEGLTIHAQYNMDTTVENNRSATVVGGTDTITIEAGTRTVTVKGDTKLTVQAGDRVVDVTGSYKLDTTNEISMQAPNKITLTCGGSSITMEPSKITISAGGGANMTLDANALTKSSAGSKVLLDADALMCSKAGDKVQLNGKAVMSSPSEAKVEAPTTIMSGGGGGSTTKNDASGVTVMGVKISLN